MNAPSQPSDLEQRVDALVASGQLSAATDALNTALATDPRNFSAWLQLSRIFYDQKRYAEAVRAVQTAESVDPLTADFQHIQHCMQRRDLRGAKTIATRMIDKFHGHPRAVFTLAHIAQASGDHEERIAILETGLARAPANLILVHMLIGALEDAGYYRQAVQTAMHMAEIDTGFDTLWALVTVQLRYGQNTEALTTLEQASHAAGSDPLKHSEIALVRGQLLRITGDQAASVTAFHESLRTNPMNAAAYWGLSDFKTFGFTDADRSAIETIIAAPKASPDQKSMAAFALARASESRGESDQTMALYHRANGLHPTHGFDPRPFAAATNRLIAQFDAAALAARSPPQTEMVRPVFILGLPRSGSTLLEQILASHSAIEGTMELPVLPSIKRRAHLLCLKDFGGDYLDRIGRLAPQELEALGRAYLEESAFFRRSDTAFFTDKLPYNFEHIGLIHKILPDAIIIDARRNPMDTGLSLYKQRFTRGSDYSYNLGHIGAYYNGYLDIMDHWDRVLPGRVLRVQYEDLVAAPEPHIRDLLSAIGLPFEAQCLDFHTTKRDVRTASSEQVRQPLNASGIGRWRAVERHLEPLKASLGSATLARFESVLG